jgi:hypothetical protein
MSRASGYTHRRFRPDAVRTANPAIIAPAFPAALIPGTARATGRNSRPAPRPTSGQDTLSARPVRGRPWKASGYTDRATGTDAVRYTSVDTAT